VPTIADTSLRIERSYSSSPERVRVFEALTNADKLQRWFAPAPMEIPLAEVDLRVGGKYTIVMQGDKRHTMTREFKEISPPERLVYTWLWTQSTPADTEHQSLERESLVTWELRPDGQGTLLILTHEQLSDPESTATHEQGWNACLDRLPEAL
jgi:uncharacterized protein YndB with AHSA1/START domain